MNLRKEVCIIVDAYTTANKLAGVINAYGYPCIHVQSNPFIPEVLQRSFRPSDFIESYICEDSPELLSRQILGNGYQIKCVIPGSESGVILGDYLAKAFNTPGNDVESSLSRRNKYVMMETVRSNSLSHIKQIKTGNIKEIYEWIEKNQLNPVVLKPLLSCATNGFHICQNKFDIEKAFQSLHLSKDIFGNINHEILVQEYIMGQEYAVNFVSYEGQHHLSEIWKTDKKFVKHSKIYDLEILLAEDDKYFPILVEYAKKVLKVLKIDYGPSHIEIYIKPDGTPVLVEAAARFMGSIDLALITKAYGTNPVLLTAEAFLNSDKFIKRLQTPKPKLAKYSAMVQLISSQDGILKEYSLEKLKCLKTFFNIDLYVKTGDVVQQTIDSCSIIGRVDLMGDSSDEIEYDHALIRSMEQDGEIYTVEPITKKLKS